MLLVKILFLFLQYYICCIFFFFFQAEDGIRDVAVTGVQTCALPIFKQGPQSESFSREELKKYFERNVARLKQAAQKKQQAQPNLAAVLGEIAKSEIGRASCRERV